MIRFIGLSPGQLPFGRQPLFEVDGIVMTKGEVKSRGIDIPHDQEKLLQQALQDWNNSGYCDDNLSLFHPAFQ